MNKLLILLIFFFGASFAQDAPEIIVADGVIKNVLITVHYYESYDALHNDFPDWGDTLEGLSNCERKVKMNIAYCDIYVLIPTVVDGEHTLTLGHEVMHGILGPRYHK